MAETRKLAAILAADVVGYSKLAGADEDRTLARLRALRSDLIDPTIAVHNGRVVKRTGDGSIIEFRSVVDAVRCAIEVQNGMVERNAGLPPERRIEFRVGIHLGDVVEETDGDLMGDGVNIAARLEGIAKPGTICLSEDAYRQVKSRLDLAVSDLGAIQLKNIAEPVRVYAIEVGKSAQAKPTKPAVRKRWPMFALLGAGIVALVTIAAGAWYLFGANRTTTHISNKPAHLSIVVLPFANLSGDPSQDYFADGITENLTTDLSRIRNSFVIGRNTAFTFKGKNVDSKEISKELGVRYVLEGSVQRDQNRVRVNAQLIDGETAAHLWADRFEESIADLFKLQDQVVARLANTLGYELAKAEAQKSTHATDPDAIDLMMRGWSAIWPPPTKESTASARDYFERASKIDPQNAEAMVGLVYARFRAKIYGWSTTDDTYPAQFDLLTKATAIDPRFAFAYYVKSLLLFYLKQLPEAIEAGRTAVALDPNMAHGYFGMAQAESYLGRCEQSKGHVKQALGLSPRDPLVPVWHMFVGVSEACLGQLDAAIGELNQTIDAGYRTFFIYAYLAGVEAARGNDAAAKLALGEARRLNPQLTVKWYAQNVVPPPTIFLDGWRKAGMPEE
jgi:adenylate cyclase